MTHSRQYHCVRLANENGISGDLRLHAEIAKRFRYRRQVASSIIYDGDHSNPLVLGSTRAKRLSFEHANRSARANALKLASIL